MQLDFRNINTLWSSIIVETLSRLGLTTAVICPGSRSTPLTVAFASHSKIDTIPILDERSAAFFALGIAKRTHLPVALICTSGTAGANFYPAVIEGKESQVPLLIFTADRPPELRNCHAGQTIDQVKLYGNYCNWYIELSLPSVEIRLLSYLRQTIIAAWDHALVPYKGIVHLNCPFREPLAPIIEPNIASLCTEVNFDNFFLNIYESNKKRLRTDYLYDHLNHWLSQANGIIIAGVGNSNNTDLYCNQIFRLSTLLNYPVLAEALCPFRNHAQGFPNLINTYDILLRNQKLADELVPDVVIQIGEFPTSKQLREWLTHHQVQHWVIDSRPDSLDPLHNNTYYIRTDIHDLEMEYNKQCIPGKQDLSYLQQWKKINKIINRNIKTTLDKTNELIEAKLPFILSKNLQDKTSIFIANSMPVRYAEFFWMPNKGQFMPYFNRGANGIEGTLSTALGVAYKAKSSLLITGDLALLHDTNGWLIRQHFQGHLTIILINNNGGGIFEMLPIAKEESVFESYFATPQNINFSQLCSTYNVEHILIKNWTQLKRLLNPLPSTGIRVLELQTDRKKDALWLQDNMKKLSMIDNK
ncbi:2-succinyl-6-hydroxy-2, 4-cyclohexadiene-1-carboxylic acid synthase/2-oxoglutarate decarboxylase [Crocosphaera subtropica ATCC 51142]|uniref:2-succinyl-5-enolpyruvyl-6-hydroxy-3-cyclohexene-1-carboxylate synthase n=1 Tax=Crocosphaera subtropica (strain ATCC 51142 / BH68) TaxID=43989 RepID=MEND_CROS5|nr:2-succinyl-5-enolpyruvyl-6-hydroxy-3-cyclohexene-1-carboxylic-acid synthase [Crocosphaera subtropica]B1WZR3.1 RecName: Full=2-succinyl-5-enolpyruvyl-6-hydroxy-3-cyclohexene-1-carboxylate synthase; Short=SEPHCHC synthase [Crocosphaera subtropica ATCC 51142]ACB51215.1 2-succinyl-6-hydroxy-2, 4-cyclohexadiene-1-carboxylic acid synthase/2-oxoglutarate decarboxylase [Crocosphaera subtropica ATCC 51142]